MLARRGIGGIARTHSQQGGQHHAPTVLRPGKSQIRCTGGLGGPGGRSGRARKTSPHLDSIPVASRYTDYTILVALF